MVKPEAVSVIGFPEQELPDGFVVRLPIAGQMLQPPGPNSEIVADAVQVFGAVTVTLYVPTVKPVWFCAVGFTPGPVHANV